MKCAPLSERTFCKRWFDGVRRKRPRARCVVAMPMFGRECRVPENESEGP